MTLLRQTFEGSFVVALPRSMTISQAREIGAHMKLIDPRVEFAEPNVVVRAFTTTPVVRSPTPFSTTLSWDRGLNLTKAWAISLGSDDVKVGVVDSGLAAHHLLSRVAPGYDFVPQIGESGVTDIGRDDDARDPGDFTTAGDMSAANLGCPIADSTWHGSGVAGTIAADRDDRLGIAGVMQRGFVVPLRAAWKCGAYLSDVVDAVLWGAGISVPGAPLNPNPVRVINISLGYNGECSKFESSAYQRVYDAGVTVIAAAGNDAGDSMKIAPGNCPQCNHSRCER